MSNANPSSTIVDDKALDILERMTRMPQVIVVRDYDWKPITIPSYAGFFTRF